MTLLDIITRAASNVGSLKEVLVKARAALPDLAGQIDTIIAALDAAVTQEGLVALAVTLPPEIANIASGKIEPRDHAGDAV